MTNLMIIINPSLAHAGTVALKAFYGLIRFKRFVSQFLRELCNYFFSSTFSTPCIRQTFNMIVGDKNV
jgi:hypothetical protein